MNQILSEIKKEQKDLAKKIVRLKSLRKSIPNDEFNIKWKLDSKLCNIRRNYRITHIAYCELLGTPKELIESTTHNEIMQGYVFEQSDALKLTFITRMEENNEQVVCLSA